METIVKKKLGRPVGSKNKPKVKTEIGIKTGLYNVAILHDRSILVEGRSYGMAFAFINKKYETVHPISPCKDYMNDIVWAENTGKYCGVYGLSYTPTMDFLANSKGEKYNTFEMVITDSTDSKSAKFFKLNQNQLLNSLDLVNKFETKLGIPHSQIELCPDNIFNIVRFDKKWVEEVYMISLYTLLWRIGMIYNKETEVLEYIKSTKVPSIDVSICQGAFPQIEKIWNEGTLNKNTLKPELNSYTVHNNLGIVNIVNYN